MRKFLLLALLVGFFGSECFATPATSPSQAQAF